MRLRDLLCLPWKRRRARTEARSEVDPIEGRRVDPVDLPRSRPDLRTESLILPTSVPSISQNREPNGTRTIPRGIHLTILPPNLDNVAPDPTQLATETGEGKQSKTSEHTIKPSVAGESGSNRKSTVYSATKLAANLVKGSVGIFPPLKSVTRSLSAILNHSDVWFTSRATLSTALTDVLAKNVVPRSRRIVDAPS